MARPEPPDAFLSYTRFDDRHERGKISEFAKRLADMVRAVTGEPLRPQAGDHRLLGGCPGLCRMAGCPDRQAYRLLSEAEWEYACRAGTSTRYSWGDEIAPDNANYGHNLGRTSEVSSYRANPWGLFDMHGNVWEWVEDCWSDRYDGAPDDGSAWTSGDCRQRVLRGGTWRNVNWDFRSANRFARPAHEWVDDYGFRVARMLDG